MRVEDRIVESPAKFEYQEETKTTTKSSAEEASEPTILENGTKKLWSTQKIKVSVKDLSKDD